jgi:hypothetical protein
MGAPRSAPRCHPCGAPPGGACHQGTVGQSVDGRARDSSLRLDTENKTLGATAWDEEARAASRTQGAQSAQDPGGVGDAWGSTITVPPTYARAPHGARAVDQVPRPPAHNTPLIASMTTQGLGAALLVDGATDGIAFAPSGAPFLVPTRVPGTRVVMDHLPTRRRGRAVIAACGCTVLDLPSSAPDVAPLEEACAKLQARIRHAKARTRAALYEAIATSLTQITAADAHGYCAHGGSGPAVQ